MTHPANTTNADYDYVSSGFIYPGLDEYFPNRVAGNKHDHPWVYLRATVPHTWYVDWRNPLMGWLSNDEAAALHTLARVIPNARALEVGSHRGWSTAHVATAVATLDVVDPAFAEKEWLEDVAGALQRCGVLDRCSLFPGFSPSKVAELHQYNKQKQWDFAFIDGNHEGDASRLDAATVSQYMAKNAIVVFHDLSSPDVANGLAFMRSLGWRTMIFQTMQILGVAWRGDLKMPVHTPDPRVHWDLPAHLHSFGVSGETDAERIRRIDRMFANLTSYDLRARQAAYLLPGAVGPIEKFTFGFFERTENEPKGGR